MDSLTQAALGAAVTGACVPAGQRGRAMLAGAMLGTLPDLDVLIDYGDAVSNFTKHRGFSHSLFVLPGVAVAIWATLRRWWAPVRDAPWRWFAGIFLALFTHPLIDAHTAYGTQLFWPLEGNPVMWSTLFIIDPLFTLPLLVGIVAVAWSRTGRDRGGWLKAGLALSAIYLGWSWAAKLVVEQNARDALEARGIEYSALFTTPAPFNTLLWRVVALDDDRYHEGFDSMIGNPSLPKFDAYPSGRSLADEAGRDIPAVGRLDWFASGFIKAERDGGSLLVADLRMGIEPAYVFRHRVGVDDGAGWQPVEPELLDFELDDRDLERLWTLLTGD